MHPASISAGRDASLSRSHDALPRNQGTGESDSFRSIFVETRPGEDDIDGMRMRR